MKTWTNSYFCIDPWQQPNWTEIFGNDHPLYLEIGSGKGEFISEYSKLYPDRNILGCEVRPKRIKNILNKIDPAVDMNVRLLPILVDVRIAQIFAPDSIDGIFIQYPDPWPKRKHHKNRLIRQDFIDAIAVIMRLGATVQVSTDHNEYAMWILREFTTHPRMQSVYPEGIRHEPDADHHIVTWFERKQRRLGLEPNYMLFRKKV